MPWKFIEKIKKLFTVPYDLFRFFVGFITVGYVIIQFSNPGSMHTSDIWIIIFLYGLLFFFKIMGKKISKNASDEHYYSRNRKHLPAQVENDIYSYIDSLITLPRFIVINFYGIKVETRYFEFSQYSLKDITNLNDLAGVAYQMADTINSRYNFCYEVKPKHYHSSQFQETDLTGFILKTKDPSLNLEDW